MKEFSCGPLRALVALVAFPRSWSWHVGVPRTCARAPGGPAPLNTIGAPPHNIRSLLSDQGPTSRCVHLERTQFLFGCDCALFTLVQNTRSPFCPVITLEPSEVPYKYLYIFITNTLTNKNTLKFFNLTFGFIF